MRGITAKQLSCFSFRMCLLRVLLTAACCFAVVITVLAECPTDQDKRSIGNSGILVTDFTVDGTQSLTTQELAAITGQLAGYCFNDDSEEIEERIRALFQDQGYFVAKVKGMSIRPVDPLSRPKPVRIEAAVVEGPRYRLAGITFSGNRHFSTTTLRGKFPIREGALFKRSKVAGGLEALRDIFVGEGFLDFYIVPDTTALSDAKMMLNLTVHEGPQYRMRKLDIVAPKELTDKLTTHWEMSEGAVFDKTYIQKYVDANRSSLPNGFTNEDIHVVRDCPKQMVDVWFMVQAVDPVSTRARQNVECEEGKDDNK